jgi:hypothetical protein
MHSILGRTLYSLGWAGIIAGLILAVWMWLALFWPHRGLTEWRFTLETPVVVRGELLRWHIRYCVDTAVPIPSRVSRELELQDQDGVTFPLVDLDYTILSRCETKFRAVGIPTYAPPGRYHLHLTTNLEVNQLRTIRQVWISPVFEVVK